MYYYNRKATIEANRKQIFTIIFKDGTAVKFQSTEREVRQAAEKFFGKEIKSIKRYK